MQIASVMLKKYGARWLKLIGTVNFQQLTAHLNEKNAFYLIPACN